MPFQIAIAFSKDCEKELKEKGFEKQEVYIKHFSKGHSDSQMIKNGDKDFFAMQHKPYQFLTSNFWGAGPD
jgi:hypothetical protein